MSSGRERPRFDVLVDRRDGETVVCVLGELDLTAKEELLSAVRDALSDIAPVLLDLSRVEFMDSTGIRALNQLVREADGAGRTLEIGAALQPQVARVLELTGMGDVLPLRA
ncbi:MAG: hypothetical protein JWO90_1519 [Solirubrobacterales bacterium]|jgi:anti-sigma B factor antagonist|nr:hypothetical protein [Solirubrobacterales bacterium]